MEQLDLTQLKTLPDEVWNIGLFDAHCHPTDNLHRIESGLSSMKTSMLTIMATRFDDQERVHEVASTFSDRIVPSFGFHPWFSYLFYTSSSPPTSKNEHYRSVLFPEPDNEFLDLLPPPRSLDEYMLELSKYLQIHPTALVGEIGIDRSFRIPKSGKIISYNESEINNNCCNVDARRLSPYRVNHRHQSEVLLAQLKVAVAHERPVSVHGVQAHGILFEEFSKLWADYPIISRKQQKRQKQQSAGDLSGRPPLSPFPTRICLHSYSGSPDQISLWLNPRKVPALVYFSFSFLINQRYGDKFTQVIQKVPDDRLLIETDFPLAGETMDGLQAEILILVCEIKNWTLMQGARILAENWKSFVYGSSGRH
ncbi:TatD family [Lipomyces oligophaga]|uniref:TatD family n=1 Tax=Lipomyces oligophaga TaxID=45792 RepID=UPI0034CEE0D2